jgi:hypothetical protein
MSSAAQPEGSEIRATPSKEQARWKADEREQALAIFNHAAEELRSFKGKRWHVAHYTLR